MTIGTNIKNIRKKLNMTQGELSEGICTQSQISKIEKDEIIPLASLLIKIAQKLDVSTDTLAFGCDIYQKDNVQFIDYKTIDDLLKRREYNQINNMISEIDTNNMSLKEKLYIQYVLLVVNNYISSDSSLEKLRLFYKENQEILNDELKIRVLNSLGIMELEYGEHENAKKLFSEGYYMAIQTKDYEELFFKISYNYMRLLFDMKSYKELYEVSSIITELSYLSNNFSCYAESIYFKCYAMDELKLYSIIDFEEVNFSIFISSKKKNYDLVSMIEKLKKRILIKKYKVIDSF